jgi:hypothetical protein
VSDVRAICPSIWSHPAHYRPRSPRRAEPRSATPVSRSARIVAFRETTPVAALANVTDARRSMHATTARAGAQRMAVPANVTEGRRSPAPNGALGATVRRVTSPCGHAALPYARAEP